VSDFIGSNGVGTWPAPAGGSVLGTGARPAANRSEYGIKHFGNDVVVMVYDNEGAALRTLTHQRADLKRMGIPETYWPVLVKRSVETITGSWRHLDD
jgi:hypothetical protein